MICPSCDIELLKHNSHPLLPTCKKCGYLESDHFPDASNMVEYPPHYTAGKVECIDAIQSAVTGLNGQEAYLVGNIIKYCWRFKRKNGIEDLKKAEWYLKRLMEVQDADKKRT